MDFWARFEALERRVKSIEDTLNNVVIQLRAPAANEDVDSQSVENVLSVTKSGPYLYRSLDVSSREIRILVLYSSPDDQDPIACELLHVSLDHNPSEGPVNQTTVALQTFNTLSYTWGDLVKKSSVTIEGHRFPVTENLESALRHMRNLKATSKSANSRTRSFWWVDAICINQDDVLERNQQVNLMTMIYKKAASVHIWLGEEADNSGIAFNVVRQLGNNTQRGPGERDTVYPEITSDQREVHWKALTALLERPWWERVWVRQEVALASEATVHCGTQTCTFAALTTTIDILNKIDEQLRFKAIQQGTAKASKLSRTADVFTMSCYIRAYNLSCFRVGMGSRPNLAFKDLRDLIIHTRTCKATDPRDKVFSVLGLVDPEFWELKADYRLSIRETFIAVARCLISKKQSLDVLSGCQNPECLNGLPSWVPNLVDEWKARPFPFTHQRHWVEVTAGEDPDFIFGGGGDGTIRARGHRLDYIATLSDDTPNQDATTEELDALSANWKAFAATALSNPQMHVLDRAHVGKYIDDGPWIYFLSVYVDRGNPLPKTATPLDIRGDYRMAESLLLPKDDSAIKVKDMKKRVHEYLRKSGVGRRLCITKMGENKGSVVLVPADSKVGDEIWLFRGTSFPYVLRKVKDGKYVVVGEACKCLCLYVRGVLLISSFRFRRVLLPLSQETCGRSI
jgi:hypothetical protein